MAARLTQIDYDREMALVAAAPGHRRRDIMGVVRLAADPDNARAEFAIIVRSDLKGRGLGALLMQRIIAYATARGIGAALRRRAAGKPAMLKLCRELGFTIAEISADVGIARATLALSPTAPAE